jgi:hypothetical protein
VVHLLEAPFSLDVRVAEKEILMLRSVLFFLELKGAQTIDLIVVFRIFFDLIIRRNKAQSRANFGSRGQLVTL